MEEWCIGDRQRQFGRRTMMTDFSDEFFDVVVVGLGPVGATLAGMLGRANLRTLAIEQCEGIYPLSRAAHIDHEIMRIFQSLGIVEDIMPHLRVAPNYQFLATNGMPMLCIEREGVTGASGWPVSFNIYQPGIEQALHALLASLPAVTVKHGTGFTDIVENGPDGVTVSINGPSGTRLIRSRFLVACDGASSAVRTALGTPLYNYDFDEPWLVLDARVPDESGFPTSNLQICDPARPTTFVHMGPGRLRWEFMLRPEEQTDRVLEPTFLDALLKPWAGFGEIEIERSAVYRFHGLVAESWRSNSILLAGDAAHQMPPFMGQGLCSGLRDAANLAWKLERAIRTDVSKKLLDSYQAERDPQVRFVIERAIYMGRLVCTLDAEVAKRRDAEMLASPQTGAPMALPAYARGWLLEGSPCAGELFPQPVLLDEQRADDILGSGAWLIVRDVTDLPEMEGVRVIYLHGDLPSWIIARFTDWMDERAVQAVLVRPDRYIFGTGQPHRLLAAYYPTHHNRRSRSVFHASDVTKLEELDRE